MHIELKDKLLTGNNSDQNKLYHRPFSTSFSKVEVLKDGRILVLEDYYKYKYNENSNFYCLNSRFEIDWILPLKTLAPNDVDIYVNFCVKDNRIELVSWCGFTSELDIISGAILKTVFTK